MNADILKRVVRAIADGSQSDLDRLAGKIVERLDADGDDAFSLDELKSALPGKSGEGTCFCAFDVEFDVVRVRRTEDVVDVEGEQARVGGKVRHDAQFDLRVVGRNDVRARCGDEGGPDASSFRRAYRDVLQIRVARRQSSGHRHRL